MSEIVIDKEFKSLIPPLLEEDRSILEQKIIDEGCQDALVLWGNILIDGHNRYEICKKHGLQFKTRQQDLPDRDAAIVWIIQNQFGRRNLSAYDRARLALRLKPVISAQAEKRMLAGRVDPTQKSAGGETRDELAKAAGVSHDTIAKVEKIEAMATPEVKEKLSTGEMSINQAYKNINEHKPHVTNNSGNDEWYTPKKYIEMARKVLDTIDVDPASCEHANKTVKAKIFYTAKSNGLSKDWIGNVWLNPPYSATLIKKFADKVVLERKNGNIKQGIILVNNATETKWFKAMIDVASAVAFPTGRIRYESTTQEMNTPLQGQAFIYIGDNPAKFCDVFKTLCWVAYTE